VSNESYSLHLLSSLSLSHILVVFVFAYLVIRLHWLDLDGSSNFYFVYHGNLFCDSLVSAEKPMVGLQCLAEGPGVTGKP
jgi:hypothetical protein